jgi:response regulator RpfG family c-di-GMP phosphodiesterase
MIGPSVLLLTDDRERSADVVPLLAKMIACETVDLGASLPAGLAPRKAFVFDVDLSNPDAAQRLQAFLSRALSDSAPRIFLADRSSYHAFVQAAAFGSEAVLSRPLDPDQLLTAIFGAPPELPPVVPSAEVAAAAECAAHATSATFDALRADKPLNVRTLAASGEIVDDAIMQAGLEQWLSAVRVHHSYTYRHCTLVTGLVAAFSQDLGIGAPCRRKLMRGAMLHDIGKAAIPVAILDKPSKLNDAELMVMRGHPGHGRSFLAKHHQADAETIEMVYRHHEMLDGSGYPEGIKAPKISDAVRILTICDIFAALIEVRPYKRRSTKEEAFAMMEAMGPKLDRDLLRVFRPVALA